jgi:hypothetical protein
MLRFGRNCGHHQRRGLAPDGSDSLSPRIGVLLFKRERQCNVTVQGRDLRPQYAKSHGISEIEILMGTAPDESFGGGQKIPPGAEFYGGRTSEVPRNLRTASARRDEGGPCLGECWVRSSATLA